MEQEGLRVTVVGALLIITIFAFVALLLHSFLHENGTDKCNTTGAIS